jgi:hypothetical protein
MDNQFDERATLATSIRIPTWVAVEIKMRGMTYSGAVIAGLTAIKERERFNQEEYQLRKELKETQENMRKYRDRWLELLNEKEGVKG